MKFNNYPIKYLILSIILTILASTGCQETKTGPNFIRGNAPNVVIPKTAAPKTTAPRALTRVQQVHNERRIALVIGNNNYQHTYQLYNAVADAQAFHQELKRRGFEVVYRENATRRIMNHAVDEFLAKLSSGSIGLIYYSGHGVQIDSSNYLLPTDIKAETSNDVMHDGISLNKLIDRASNMQTKFMLAIIDACRNNPFALANTPTLRSIGTTKGLAPPLGNATGVMIVYSAGANQTALDKLGRNDNHPNGLFAREFLKAMRIPGLTVLEVVDKVKKSVYTKAKQVAHVQTPAVYDQSMGTFYFSRISKEDLAFKKRQQQLALQRQQAEQQARLQAEQARLARLRQQMQAEKEQMQAEKEQMQAEMERLNRLRHKQQQDVQQTHSSQPESERSQACRKFYEIYDICYKAGINKTSKSCDILSTRIAIELDIKDMEMKQKLGLFCGMSCNEAVKKNVKESYSDFNRKYCNK